MPKRPPRHTDRLKNQNPHAHTVSKKLYECFVRDASPELTESNRIRKTMRWAKVRKLALDRHPICVDPFGTHGQFDDAVASQQVHHIQGLAAAPELAYDLSNLAGLCTKCHAKVEARERLGDATQHLFKRLNADNHSSI